MPKVEIKPLVCFRALKTIKSIEDFNRSVLKINYLLENLIRLLFECVCFVCQNIHRYL